MRRLFGLLVAFAGMLPAPAIGQDPTTCQGHPITIFGTEADEEIFGTAEADVIAAFRGNDTVRAGDGHDVVCGGGGFDFIEGNDGNDALRGGGGADLILGGNGDDLLLGSRGDDVIDGGSGANTCLGGAGQNVISYCDRAVPSDFSGVVWLHTDVSGWAVTSPLDVSFSGGLIILDYDKANVWPAIDGLNANPWIFVFQDGTWYAATWEWMRFGQTAKNKSSVAGDHIKQAPLQDFRPVSGESYGFMVSGLARDGKRNVLERTDVVMVRWP